MEEPLAKHSSAHSSEVSTPSQAEEIWSFVKTLVLLLGIAFIIRAMVVEPFKIPSESMVPTLQVGDQLLVTKLAYGLRLPFMTNTVWQYGVPHRGDIVVFTRPDDESTPDEDESAINIIKRVIGLPGEMVEVSGKNVLIDNRVLQEDGFARYIEGGLVGSNFGPERIPEGHVFLMGDNRDHSRDSRFWDHPFLDVHRIKGRAMFIYWSWEDYSRIGNVLR